MSRLLYLARRIALSMGYGGLYNWWCTQEQAIVEYGYLYNGHCAIDSRNIASSGFHVPSITEYRTLSDYLGGGGQYQWNTVGAKLKETGTTHWTSPNTNATNISGFNARAGGYRSDLNGVSGAMLSTANYWTSTQQSGTLYYNVFLNYSHDRFTSLYTADLKSGESIRLLKDSTTLTNGQTGVYVGNDGKLYPTICIGTQEWLACDLMETRYRNGDLITVVTNNTTWSTLTTEARCVYGNTESNAGTTKKLAPTGWHVPTETEWDTLITELGGYTGAGGILKETGTTSWNSPNTGAVNSEGFNIKGAGYRDYSTGLFIQLKLFASFWASTLFSWSTVDAFDLTFAHNSADALTGYLNHIPYGLSVRLVKDTDTWTSGETLTDEDGNVYETVKIGDQVWIASNYKCTKWNDGTAIPNVTDATEWAVLTTPAYCWFDNDISNK